MPQSEDTLRLLRERIKELTALHKTARLLQDDRRSPREIMGDIVTLLPDAWQFPDVASASISFDDWWVTSAKFLSSPWMQSAEFVVRSARRGRIEIAYATECSPEAEGPFLAEERELLDSLAEMLRSYFERKLADDELHAAHDNLERLVAERTNDLRRLAAELSLAEARKDREIATLLHDKVIQEFAFMKLQAQKFRGDAVFCGFEHRFDEIIALLERAIQQTRKLTFDISSPILYELGLAAALEWLAEHFEQRHNLAVEVAALRTIPPLSEAINVTLYRSAQELLTNCVKYAQARSVVIEVQSRENQLVLIVRDDGAGFDSSILDKPAIGAGFGLFSIRERLGYFGGALTVESSPGVGTAVTLSVPVEPR
ncbi:MAG: sensor histidine kinase [bacterium]|nr:sensor histidine kinase [bacterium]